MYGGFGYYKLVGNTRTDYAVMGKIVRGPSTSFLGETQIYVLGQFCRPLWGQYLIYFDPIRCILFTFGPGPAPWPRPFSLGPWPARAPLMEAEGYSRRVFFFWKSDLF